MSNASVIANKVSEDIIVNRVNEGGTLWIKPEEKTGYVVGGRIPELVFPEGTEKTVIADMVSDHFLAHRNAVVAADCVGWWLCRGNIHVDVNDHVEGLATALALGKSRGELGIWDIANECEIIL